MKDPYSEHEQPDIADPNWRHPVEEMEPMDRATDFRHAALRFSGLLNKALIFILDSPDKRLASWQIAYALGLPVCEGQSMTDRSVKLGITRAAFSKGAKAFLRAAHLPPSEHMKSADSTGAYAIARTSQLS